jgi:hypothetical protein
MDVTWVVALAMAAAQWVCDPALAALFTPARPDAGRYEVCTNAADLDSVMVDLAAEGIHLAPAELLNPVDAFGASGAYNRAALARLYGGRRVRVARGWAQRSKRFESVTLLSPYPDSTLTTLQPGTMAIRLTLERRGL